MNNARMIKTSKLGIGRVRLGIRVKLCVCLLAVLGCPCNGEDFSQTASGFWRAGSLGVKVSGVITGAVDGKKLFSVWTSVSDARWKPVHAMNRARPKVTVRDEPNAKVFAWGARAADALAYRAEVHLAPLKITYRLRYRAERQFSGLVCQRVEFVPGRFVDTAFAGESEDGAFSGLIPPKFPTERKFEAKKLRRLELTTRSGWRLVVWVRCTGKAHHVSFFFTDRFLTLNVVELGPGRGMRMDAGYSAEMEVAFSFERPAACKFVKPFRPRVLGLRVAEAPRIDGVLGESLWRRADVLGDFVALGGTGFARERTFAAIAYDRERVYIAFDCNDSADEELRADAVERDDLAIFRDDHIEVFVAPNERGRPYFHFAVNVLGTGYDAREFDSSWDAFWSVRVTRRLGGWSGEMAIPFAALELTDAASGPWRVNICRTRSLREHSSWAPLRRGFHEPENFGVLAGLQIQPAFLKVDWKLPAVLLPRPGTNILSVQVQNHGERDRTVRLRGTIMNGQDAVLWRSATRPALVQRGARAKLALRYPNVHGGPLSLVVELLDARSEVTLRQRAFYFVGTEGLAVQFDRSYYTDEGRALVRVELLGEELARSARSLHVVLVARDGRGVWEKNVRAQARQFRFAVPLRWLATGRYVLKVAARAEKGRELEARTLQLDKLVRAPGEVKITDTNAILVDGKPFFPIGLWGFSDDERGKLSVVKAAGFNTVMYDPYPRQGSSSMVDAVTRAKAFMAEAQRLGLKVVVLLGKPVWAEEKKPLSQVDFADALRIVSALRDSPALLAWYPIDEPSYRVSRKFVRALHAEVRQADPRHPIFMSDSSIRSWPYYSLADIAGYHVYPIRVGESDVSRVGRGLDRVRASVANRRPLISTVQMYFDVFWREPRERMARLPTLDEVRCMTYLAIVHGAKGILYFSYHWWVAPAVPKKYCLPEQLRAKLRLAGHYTIDDVLPRYWDGVSRLVQELNTLGSELLECGEEATPQIECEPHEALHAVVKQTRRGAWLIAVNASGARVSARISELGLHNGRAGVMFEDRSVAVRRGTVEDEFAPLQARVYRLEAR